MPQKHVGMCCRRWRVYCYDYGKWCLRALVVGNFLLLAVEIDVVIHVMWWSHMIPKTKDRMLFRISCLKFLGCNKQQYFNICKFVKNFKTLPSLVAYEFVSYYQYTTQHTDPLNLSRRWKQWWQENLMHLIQRNFKAIVYSAKL